MHRIIRISILCILLGLVLEGGCIMATFGKIGARPLITRWLTAKDYVQNGLVAMWDGIENAGRGKHTTDGSNVKELVTQSTCQSASGISNNSFQYILSTPDFSTLTNAVTMELVINIISWRTTNTGSFFTPEPWVDNVLELFEYPVTTHLISSKIGGGTKSNSNARFILGNQLVSVTQGTDRRCYLNGVLKATIAVTASLSKAKGKSYAIRIPGGLSGDIYCFRVYNRALTAEEVAYNYSIDKIRFNLA